MDEFELIRHFFEPLSQDPAGGTRLVLGIGDDCAILRPHPELALAVSTDTLVADVHFPADADPAKIARRALRVNLSDLAAMGADPMAFTLSLTLPRRTPGGSKAFAAGLRQDVDHFRVPLAGGDTNRGPLAVGVSVYGEVDPEFALTRLGAQPGHGIFVTGTLGDAAGGLRQLGAAANERYAHLAERYWLPEPRLSEGRALSHFASAGIDVSDGLVGDLGHLFERNRFGAALDRGALPLSPVLIEAFGRDAAEQFALTGGDDYELLFTLDLGLEAELERRGVQATRIGQVVAEPGIRDDSGSVLEAGGYRHFR